VVAASRDELKKAENEVALRVHELYYGILITRLQKQAAEQESAYAAARLRESEEDVRNGSALKIAAIEGRAGLLESEQSVLTATLRLSDLTTELNEVLGLPLDTRRFTRALNLVTPSAPRSQPWTSTSRRRVSSSPSFAS
jgi:outer membrane protein TolC